MQTIILSIFICRNGTEKLIGIRKEGGKGKPAKAKYELDFTKSLSINW